MSGFKSPPPFAKGKQQEPAAEEVKQEPQAEEKGETMTEQATQEVQAEAPKKTKNKTTITNEHIKFVRQNVKTMGYNDMAEKLGLTKNQINRILQTLKEGMRAKAVEQDANAYGTKQNKKGETVYDWTQPKSDFAQKVEKKIAEELSRPAESRPGAGGGGGGKVQQALDAELDDLLSDL